MCGIVGCTGFGKDTVPFLIDGLKKLEYRGYDSAGIGFKGENMPLIVAKALGPIKNLESEVERVRDLDCSLGLGHTRWSTCGAVTKENCHPHTYGCVTLVHNGIIENCDSIEKAIEQRGHDPDLKKNLKGETDSELLAAYIYNVFKLNNYKDPEKVLDMALKSVAGAYALVIHFAHSGYDEKLYCARNGSPLVIGYGTKGMCVASDKDAIAKYCTKVVALEDNDLAEITSDGVTFYKDLIRKEYTTTDIDEYKLEDYESYLLQEIMSQPASLAYCISGRYEEFNTRLGGLAEHKNQLKDINRFIILGEGTSYHAGLVGKYLIEDIAGIPVEVDYASEFAYRNPIIEPKTAVIAISQSGETADLLKAVNEAKSRGALIIGITNGIDSSLTRLTDCGVYMRCGKEISVASTKSFTSSITVLYMMAIYFGRMRHLSMDKAKELIKELNKFIRNYTIEPDRREAENLISQLEINEKTKLIFVGKGEMYPIALEACLKLTEISYIQCTAYSAGSLKHGPLALVDENTLAFVFYNPDREVLAKKCKNCMDEIKSRNGQAEELKFRGDTYFPIIRASIVAQLIAYYIAKDKIKIENIDKPRNLAKSVTTE